MQYLTSLPKPNYNKKFYTGHAVVSHFIPEGINCDWDSKSGPASIRNGELLYGVLDSKGIQSGSMVLGAAFIYHYGHHFGIRKLAEFIDHINRLFFTAHLSVGFTMGITDVSMMLRHFYRNAEGELLNDTDVQTILPKDFEYDLDEQLFPEAVLEQTGWEQVPVNTVIQEIYEEANEEIRILNAAFFNKTLEELDDSYFVERSRIWLTYDPLRWMELAIGDVTENFYKTIIKLTKRLQGSSNALNISVESGARAGNDNIQQMSGSYGQVRVSGSRVISGASVGRPFPHFAKGDYSGEAFGFLPNSYSEGLSATGYFFASIAGRRAMMESGAGAIQKSGYLEHKLKRASENLMIDDRGYLVDVRSKKVLAPYVGDDGLRPFHTRGPDNPNGLQLSLQPFWIEQTCVHGIPLYDVCDTCQGGTTVVRRGKFLQLPKYIAKQVQEKLSHREVESPGKMVSRLHEYYSESRVEPGEMIGATGAANVGEPVTQAGLRAFHGGGKGTTPTVERISQLLELSRSNVRQPQTVFYLKPEFNNEKDAKELAIFCSSINFSDIVELTNYDYDNLSLDITFDQAALELFRVDTEFVINYLSYKGKTHEPSFKVVGTEEGCRVTYSSVEYSNTARSFLLLMKESIIQYQIHGLVKGGRAFPDFRRHPIEEEKRWTILVLGPNDPSPNTPNPMMLDASATLGQYIDEDLTQTNNPFFIAQEYGLEAALACIKELFWEQMNGNEETAVNGMGELDFRYIDAMVDNMGQTGYLSGLGKSGNMVSTVTSLIGGIGGEDPGMSLRAHTTMATRDTLSGMVEAVASGKLLSIGQRYARKSSEE